MIKRFLSHPQTRHLELDDPATTRLRKDILRNNLLLRKVYQCWYEAILDEVPNIAGGFLELGTGPGFLKERVEQVITTDILWVPGIDLVLNAQALPFAACSLRAIVMTNVLHHIPKVGDFFSEASRCLVQGGKVVMVEPWLTGWSRFIYRNFHHEPMNPAALSWEFPSDGPVSSANEALPWIIFKRDRELFEAKFPEFSIQQIEPIMPILYLISGGFSSRIFPPGWSFIIWREIEELLFRWRSRIGMFALIVISKESQTC